MTLLHVLIKKEVKDYYRSPFFYALAGIFILIIGILFFNLLVELVQLSKTLEHMGKTQFDFATEVIRKTYGNMNFLFIFFVPILTMGILSDESKNGTLDFLRGSKLSELHIVFGKYTAALIMVSGLMLVSLLLPLTVFFSGHSDWYALFSSYLGVFLNLAFMIAAGMFFSSVFRTSILAGVSTLVFIFFLWILSWLASNIDNKIISEALSYFALMTHFEHLMSGRLYLSDITFYVLGIVYFLYLSIVMVKSRGWN